jgi:protein SCO1/2
MFSFLKHKFSRKDRALAKWSLSHAVLAVIVGGLLAAWIVVWQAHKDETRVEQLNRDANASVDMPSPIPPTTGPVGGPFSLTGPEGQTVTDKDFAGKYLLVYFGYTSCPDMCPTGLQSMSRALDMVKTDEDKVQPLFITVDPARDTPQRLKEYDAAFHPKIIGLTGTPEQVAAVAKKYQVYYERGEGDGEDYEMDHTSLIFLIDPQGHLVTTFDEEADPRLIATAMQKAWGGEADNAASSSVTVSH